MKYYLDIETSAVYQFETQPTSETKYRFIEVASSWFIEENSLEVFNLVRDTISKKVVKNEKQSTSDHKNNRGNPRWNYKY